MLHPVDAGSSDVLRKLLTRVPRAEDGSRSCTARDLERDVLERGHAAEPDLGPLTRQQDQGRRHESARPRRGFRTGSLAAMTLGRRLVLMRSRRRLGTTAIVQVFGRRHRDRRHLLGRPASKKRQGTKSRGGLGGGRQPALWRFDFRAGYGGGRGVGVRRPGSGVEGGLEARDGDRGGGAERINARSAR